MKTLSILIYAINFILILSVIFIEHKKPAESLLWVLLLIIFPVLGFVLYMAFGFSFRYKMMMLTKKRRIECGNRKLFYNNLKNAKDYDIFKINTESEMQDIASFNLNYSRSRLLINNTADIIIKGSNKYKMLFSDIDNAKHSIHVLYFLIHNDSTGNEFIERLTKKAKEGVSVKVLYDGLSNINIPYKIFKPLTEAGGEVKRLKAYITHYRNHRKIVVIDGKIGYTGGMNIGDEYANISEHKPFWRDTHLRFEGDAVYMLQYYFLYDWFYIANSKEKYLEKKIIMDYFPDHNIDAYLPCQIVASGADYDCGHIKMGFLKMIYSAKQKIRIQSPYFIPNESIMEAIAIMASCGVKIELMVPSKASYIITMTNNYYINRLIDYGVKVYLYNGYIHSKTLSVDGMVTSIGTANMDYRSMDVDDELTVFFYDKKFTQRHENIFESDKKNSVELNYEAFYKRSYIKKGIEKLCRLFAPLM